MKKLLASIVSGAVLLAACPVTSFADEDTPSDTEQTTASETETPEKTPEEQKDEEIASVRDRVEEGLRIFQEKLKECADLENKLPDPEKTQKLWADFFSKQCGGLIIPFTKITDMIDRMREMNLKAPDYDDEEQYTERVEEEVEMIAEMEGTEAHEIPRWLVAPYLVDIVQKCMPAEEWEKMTASPDQYSLMFLDGAIGTITNPVTGQERKIALMPERFDMIHFAEGAVKLHDAFSFGEGDMIVETPLSLVFRGIANIAFEINEYFRELMYIENTMAALGIWHISDDITRFGDGAKPSSGRPNPDDGDYTDEIGQKFNTVTPWYADLFSGDDTYIMPSRAYSDKAVYAVISESSASAGSRDLGDTVYFEYEVSPEDIELLRIDDDLYMNDPVNERYIYIPNEFAYDSTSRIENIEFADGTVIDYQELLFRVNVFIGTEEADEFTGYPESCRIFGKGGDDVLTGKSRTNYILGYDGNDSITAGSRGLLNGEGDPHFLYGMDGDDTILGGAYDDFIYGGKGDDEIVGGPDDDIFYYELGDGNDTIDETTGKFTYPYGGNDYVVFGEGISPDEVSVSYADGTGTFVLTFEKTGETLTLPGNYIFGFTPVFPIEHILFADDTDWTLDTLIERAAIMKGTDGDDELHFAGDENATIDGFGGNDDLRGSGGNDILYCGKGDDYLCGYNGDDTYYYEAGDGNDKIDEQKGYGYYPYGGHDVVVFGEGISPDEVTVELSLDFYTFTIFFDKVGGSVEMPGNQVSGFTNIFPIEEFRFADGTVWSSVQELIDRQVLRGTDGDDSVTDTDGNDTIFCGKGNDAIRGTTGDDTYIYSTGDGFDRIIDYSIWGDSFNTLRFSEDILPEDIYTEENGRYTILYVRDMTSGISVFGIDQICFADETVWKMSEIAEKAEGTSELRGKYAGDIDNDGQRTAEDADLILGYLLCRSELAPDAALRADLNGDGSVTAIDLTLLKQMIL